MKISKIIAILGAVLILVCFFLPWESLSFMGTEIVYSGYQKSTGSPPGKYKLSNNPSDYGSESDLDYINQVWGEILGDSLSGSEIGAISGITDAINRLFAKPVLFVFPGVAILVVIFSILSNRKPHVSFGIVMVALSVSLGIMLFTQGKSMSSLMKLNDLVGSVWSLLGIQELIPTSKFEIGFYGTAAGLLAFLVAGFIGWQDYSKFAREPERASFQNAQRCGSQNPYFPQQYPANPQQRPQPQVRPDGTYYAPQDQSVFFYQQNNHQYENYQQAGPPPQQQSPNAAPPVYPNAPQPGYQAPVDQPSPQYQTPPQPQQPVPPQQNTPSSPVAGWRPIHPPKDPLD